MTRPTLLLYGWTIVDLRTHTAAVAVGIGAVLLLTVAPASARRASCENRCGFRITQCVLERGGVDGSEIGPCTRNVVDECRRRGAARACPRPTRDDVAALLAAVQAVEAAVHEFPLCAGVLPDVPAATLEEAIAVGRQAAAALAQTTDPTFRTSGRGHRPGAFAKLFLQGFFGHGVAFVPLGNAIVATARPARSLTYVEDDFGAVVHGIVGVDRGRAAGVLLTYCPAPQP